MYIYSSIEICNFQKNVVAILNSIHMLTHIIVSALLKHSIHISKHILPLEYTNNPTTISQTKGKRKIERINSPKKEHQM